MAEATKISSLPAPDEAGKKKRGSGGGTGGAADTTEVTAGAKAVSFFNERMRFR